MKIIWILLVLIGLTLTEKLDRTYLPPPGSKFSGGSPGAIDVPLEFPKETYSSGMGDNSFRRPEVTIGIDRVGPNISPEKFGDITSTEQSLQGNSFSFPTTSTSFAFSQTTSFLPSASSTIGPDILINSKYPNSISIKNNFDHNRSYNGFDTLDEGQVLNDDKKISQNQISDNGITPEGVKKINDESVHSNNRNIFNIPNIHSQTGDLGIQDSSSPLSDEIDLSLFHNNYDTYYSPSPSESISQKDGNLMSSTSIPSNNINTKTLSNSSVSITNTPYLHRTPPEGKQSQDREAVILNYDNTITRDGYAYSFDTSNGIHADEKGTAINGVQAVGSYSYIGDDGQLYNVSYTADENGFRPYGAHLPTAPPIPDAILKVIEQAAIDKANGIYHDGSYDDSKYGYRKYNPKNNIMFLNQNKKDREGTSFNTIITNNQLPYYTRSNENLNKNNGTILEHEQNITPKNNLQSHIRNGLPNESLSEISPNYKSNIEIIEKDNVKNTNNDDDNQFQNNISNAVPYFEDIGKDKIMGIEVKNDIGYHYSKPQNDYSLDAADNVINRFSETLASTAVPAMYKKIVENKPARPFMTPYVSRNDDISIKHDGDDQPLDIPAQYHEEDVILNNQKTNLPSTETKMIPGKTNENIHNFINKFKRPDISHSDGQGYLYGKNVIPKNDNLVSYITSTENGISDITPTFPTAFPSRFNTIESNEKILRNPSGHSESSLLQNQNVLPNHLLDQENYRGPVTHSNKLNSYGNIYNDDDSGFSYKMANMNDANRDTIEHSTTKTYGEDFSGPKRTQIYDPLTGYHY